MSATTALLKEAMSAMGGNPDRAATLCRAALQAEPRNIDAILLLSEALRRTGQLDEAHALVAPLAAENIARFGVQRQLGVILADKREPLPASIALQAAAAIAPAHPTIWRDLGDQLALAGDAAGAGAARARHADLPLTEPRLMRAATALREGGVAAGRETLDAFLAQHPSDVQALRLLSEAQARDDRPDEAEATLRRALALAPGFRLARHGLAQLLMGVGRFDEALAEARELLRRDPDSVGGQRLLAAIYMAMSDYERAISVYEPLLKADSQRALTWMSYGHALKTVGRTDEGVAAYRKSIALAPGLGESYWSLANLKVVRFGDADIAEMRRQLERVDLSVEDRVGLYFALGKAFEDAKIPAEAFKHYSAGAALQRQLVTYNAEALRAFVEESRRVLTADALATGGGAPAQDPIFIVGLPRAGSTLLEQILASHSMVEGTAELFDVSQIAQNLIGVARARAGERYFEALLETTPAQRVEMGERYLRTTRVHRKLGRPLFINKNPNDFQHIGLIHLMLPNAKIIDARRHPLACGWSCFKQHFALGQAFSYDLADIGRYYADYVKLMAHYDAVLPGRVHRVIHEELVADPEPHIRALLEYCGLPFEEACLRPHETQRAVRTASSEQVRKPISAKGLDDWKPYEPYLGPLKEALHGVLDAYPRAPDFD